MKNILAKLALIRNDIDPMKKDGRNEKQSYNFLSDKQITLEVGKLLEKHNVVVTHNDRTEPLIQYQTLSGATMFMTTVYVDYTFWDVDSGESLSGSVVGQGNDVGDKGVYKAITGAFKYLYVKTFNIPTIDDPENEQEDKRYAPRPVEIKKVNKL